MAPLPSPEELANYQLAHELLELKLRVPIVHYLTDIPPRPLRKRWRHLHKESPPNGQLPDSVRPFISNPAMAANLSGFVAVYDFIDSPREKRITGNKLLTAWRLHIQYGNTQLDINAAWYAIRDVRSKIVIWKKCATCQAMFLLDANSLHARSCPFCILSTDVS